MKKTDSQVLLHFALLTMVTVMSMLISRFVWIHADIPKTRLDYHVWMYGIPLCFFFFGGIRTAVCYKKSTARPFLHYEAWYGFFLLGHFVLLVAWRSFVEWQFLYSGLYCIHVITQIVTANLMINRLHARLQTVFFPMLVLLSTASIAFPLIAMSTNVFHWIQGILACLLTSLMIVIIREIALFILRFENSRRESKANWISLACLLNVAVFAGSGTPCRQHIASVFVGLITICGLQLSVWSERINYTILSAVIAISPLVSFEFSGISLWATIVGISLAKTSEKSTQLLKITGFIVLFATSIIGAVLYDNGHFLTDDPIWNSNIGFHLLGSLLDIRSGLIPAQPMIIVALAGIVSSIWFFSRRAFWICIGPILILIPIVYHSMRLTGYPPSLIQTLPLTIAVWPFAAITLSRASRPISHGFWRSAAVLQMFMAICFFVGLTGKDGYAAEFNTLLSDFARLTDIDFGWFVPHLGTISQGWTFSVLIWLPIVIVLISILVTEQMYSTHTSRAEWTHPVMLFLAALGFIALAIGSQQVRAWIKINPAGQDVLSAVSDQATFNVSDSHIVWGIRLDTYTANSPNLAQGTTAGILSVLDRSGSSQEYPIRIGIETAELAYDRADVLQIVGHQRPEIGRSWIVNMMNKLTPVHSYRSEFALQPPRQIESLSITLSPGLRMTDVKLSIDAIKLQLQSPVANWGKPLFCNEIQNVTLDSVKSSYYYNVKGIPRVSRLRIVSNLANAANVPTGISIAQAIIADSNGYTEVHDIRSGLDTAEWAYHRKDLLGKIQHSQARVIMAKRDRDRDGIEFLSSLYVADFRLNQPMIPSSITLRYVLSETTDPLAKLIVYSLMFM